MSVDPNQDPPRFVQHGPVQLAYWDYGRGPSAVLLIMGIHMRAAHWGSHFIAALAERHRVLCFDNRGTGSSTKPVDAIDATLWAADARAVLDAAGVRRAHVIGMSMGGRVAQQLAIDTPERVGCLVLLSSALGGPRQVLGTPEALGSFSPRPELTAEEQRRLGLVAVTGPGFAEREPARFARLHGLGADKRTPVSVLVKQIAVAQTSLEDRLAELTAPTLIIHGDADGLVPMANGERLHQVIPGSRFEALPGVGHLASWECPERLVELLSEFLPAAELG